MIKYDKNEIKEQLTLDNIYELLQEWGGDPEYTTFGILSATICHNEPGVGSRKLYYYTNSGLFQCYTGCAGFFDVFELTRKVADIQWHEEIDLNDAIRWVARRFGISGTSDDGEEEKTEDWILLAEHEKIKEIIGTKDVKIVLNSHSNEILSRFNYIVKIKPWLDEGISQEMIDFAKIGYYPGGEQITIPHFDEDNNLIGIRGRTLVKEEAERYGKYRPLRINKILYNHPLGMNLYGLNWNKEHIKFFHTAIIFESEKSVLLYGSYFGQENNIAVACCGSNISSYQINSLIRAGAKEIIIAFDRQFQEIGDKEFKHLKKNLRKIYQKYNNRVAISFIWDRDMITGYKASPIDEGKEKFIKLYLERMNDID